MFTKKFTVEQIHAEIDTAQDRLIDSADKLLAELNIPTESRIEKKSDMLLKFGFVNSETVKKAEVLKSIRKETETVLVKTKEEADLLKYYKQTYPMQKFLTVPELDRICDKYNLIHAPVSNYIKDVPEKNLLDIKAASNLANSDVAKNDIFFTVSSFYSSVPKDLKAKLSGRINISALDSYDIQRLSRGNGDSVLASLVGSNYRDSFFSEGKVEEVKKNGLFIAAPKSHFKLDGTSKLGGVKAFFELSSTTVTKDPIVFQYCRGNMVRIITKWGTSDDQSYLDESLTNEKMN
jgi:hypothetical protein